MAKKRKGRLIPVKKSVLDPRLGAIERTYYISPDKKQSHGTIHNKKAKDTDVIKSLKSETEKIDKLAQKMAYCNW